MEKVITHSETGIKDDIIPVLSAEIFSIPLEEGKYIIYAPLRRAAFISNTKIVNFLANLKNGIWDNLSDPDGLLTKFLRKLEIIDAGSEELPISTFSGQPEPTAVTLFLTTACSLRCTYCYAMAGDTPTQSMNIDVAKKGIDFIVANAVKRESNFIEIYYHGGGEPTANWKVMTESLEYAKSRAGDFGLEVRAYSATNGVLSDIKINWFIENIEGSSLSFDGLPEVHDTHRLTIQGKGSSKQVLKTIKRFDKADFNYQLRLTVTKDQITKLAESIEFICKNFKPKRIQVEPAYQLGRWKDAPSAETEEFIAMFRKARIIAKRYNYDLYFSSARLGILTNHFCGITQDSFALSPNGNVSACYEVFSEESESAETFFYGKPQENGQGYIFNLPVLNNLRRQAVQHRDFCHDCLAKWSCAGDCYHKSITVNGNKEFTGSDRCHITRELTKDQILERIIDSGGVFWHEPPFDIHHHLTANQ